MSQQETRSTSERHERPRQWFIGNGLAALGACVLMLLADFLKIDILLIWWAGAAGDTQAQDIIRFIFTDLMPIFLIIGAFGAYLVVRGLGIDGDTGRIRPLDAWVGRGCGLLLIAYILILVFL